MSASSPAFTFTVSLSASSPVPVSVTYVGRLNGTATAGSDYTAVPPTVLTIPANTLSGTLTVTVTGDTAGEANETFVVNLSAPINVTHRRRAGRRVLLSMTSPDRSPSRSRSRWPPAPTTSTR